MQLFKLKEWTGNYRGDLLAGILVALALIPEAISFSIIAGVDPKVGLYASFMIAVITAIFGGRPGMVSAATAATALLMYPLVSSVNKAGGDGLQYLLAASILAGILQLLWGFIKIAHQLKYVSRAVMIGFVNALAILIFMAQLPELSLNEPTWIAVYAMVAGALAIIYLLPRITTVVPSPLVAIIAITLISVLTNSSVATVGDRGELPSTLPLLTIPQIPFDLEMLQTIFPYAIAISLVGLLESFLDAAGEKRVYNVAGQIFFVSVNEFLDRFDFKEDVELVKIDLTHAHLWDQSAIAALDKVVINFRRHGSQVQVVGLNQASATLVDKLAMHDKVDSSKDLVSH